MKKFEAKFEEFHARPVRDITAFDARLILPERAALAGVAKQVMYRSDKLNPSTKIDEGWQDYYHDHDPGVSLYRCGAAELRNGDVRRVPKWIHEVQQLTWLGQCLGFTFEDDEGNEIQMKGTKPLPDLFCIPSGKALLVIQSRRTVLAMIWGGRLDVKERGIIH